MSAIEITRQDLSISQLRAEAARKGEAGGPDKYEIEPVEEAHLFVRASLRVKEIAAALHVNRLETNTCRDSFGPRRIDHRAKR
jgi:hypothetical protein